MNHRTYLSLIIIVLAVFTLTACGGRESAVTDLNQLVGLWGAEIPSGMMSIMEVNSDGTIVIAGGWERYDSGLVESFTILVDNRQVLLEGPLLCGEEVGLYEATIGSDSVLRLSVVEDPCSWRRRVIDKSEPGNLEQYELEFSRIER
jgi:hypothetical protein